MRESLTCLVRPSVHSRSESPCSSGMKSTAGVMSRAPTALASTLYSPACSAFSFGMPCCETSTSPTV